MTTQPSLADFWHHDSLYWSTVARVSPRDGFMLYTNPTVPGRYDPNHAGYIRLPDGDHHATITDIIHFFSAIDMDAVVYLDHLSTPSDFADQLRQHGFSDRRDWGVVDLMVQTSPPPPLTPSPRIQVTSTLTKDEHTTWSLIDEPDVHSPPAIMQSLRYQEVSAPEVTGFIATLDGRPVGRCLTYCNNGIGRVEAVFVHENARRQGVARHMVDTAIRHVLSQHCTPYLFAIAGNHAQQLYASLGMQVRAHDVSMTFVCPYTAT